MSLITGTRLDGWGRVRVLLHGWLAIWWGVGIWLEVFTEGAGRTVLMATLIAVPSIALALSEALAEASKHLTHEAVKRA